jgi:hypothetical protein
MQDPIQGCQSRRDYWHNLAAQYKSRADHFTKQASNTSDPYRNHHFAEVQFCNDMAQLAERNEQYWVDMLAVLTGALQS